MNHKLDDECKKQAIFVGMPNSRQLYPFKFTPILKDKIWGGDKLNLVLNKNASDLAGESWEISNIPTSESVLMNGHLAGMPLSQLISTFKEDLLGRKVVDNHGMNFPLLIKFIHASEDLSIQVHPNDEQSGGLGKTEMWYVLWAEEGASLLSGFKKLTGSDELRKAIANGTFEQYMNRIPVTAGDTFFIPANQVHTIGKGILLAEIQQSSDTTYRIYDFDRVDAQGLKRDLHVDKAFEVMNIGTETGKVDYLKSAELVQLVSCPEFITNKFTISAPRTFKAGKDRFKIYLNVNGKSDIRFNGESLTFNMGETIMLPANVSMEVIPDGSVSILETMCGI